jgi:hypothetical protein
MFVCFVGVHGQFDAVWSTEIQWFCSPFLVERCSEMELVQTCSSTSHLNVSFVYVSVYEVLNSWVT